jgi:hypothetical protein
MSEKIAVYDYSHHQSAEEELKELKFDLTTQVQFQQASWNNVGWIINYTASELRRVFQRNPLRIEVTGDGVVLSKWTPLRVHEGRVQQRRATFSKGKLMFDQEWRDVDALEVYVW